MRILVTQRFSFGGSIEINKVVDGDAANATDWTFNLGAHDPVGCDISNVTTSLTIPSIGGTESFGELPVVNTDTGANCTYFVEEVTQAGWEVSEPNPQEGLELTSGSVTAVTFTNTELAVPPIDDEIKAQSVPTLSEWSMLMLVLLMLVLAYIGLSRYARR